MRGVYGKNVAFFALFIVFFIIANTGLLAPLHEAGHLIQAQDDGIEAEIKDRNTTTVAQPTPGILLGGFLTEYTVAIVLALCLFIWSGKAYFLIGIPWGYVNGLLVAPAQSNDFYLYPGEAGAFWEAYMAYILPGIVVGWLLIYFVRLRKTPPKKPKKFTGSLWDLHG